MCLVSAKRYVDLADDLRLHMGASADEWIGSYHHDVYCGICQYVDEFGLL